MKLIGYIYISLILISVIISKLPEQKLISPLASPIVEAKETVRVSCETPKGYLECKVYKGEITWEEHDKLYKIIDCESKWNPNAINTKNKNGTYDRGLFQINSVHKTLTNEDAFNFKKNIDFGIKLFKSQGLKPWVCRKFI